MFYQTDLICGDKQKTVIEKTQIDKAKVMSHGYLHWENTIKNPLTIAQDNCSLTTSLFFNDQHSILKETDTTNNINIQNF
ncbi:MAG: hypothetical protein U9Q15_01550 [Patescibacteria group bacterium]|nr:hypothetical protein [Patescibacteria group bacterium]